MERAPVARTQLIPLRQQLKMKTLSAIYNNEYENLKTKSRQMDKETNVLDENYYFSLFLMYLKLIWFTFFIIA